MQEPSTQDFRRTAKILTGSNSQIADKPDLGFSTFAGAASFCGCGTCVVAAQRKSSNRSFEVIDCA